jgi:hypothetical protein
MSTTDAPPPITETDLLTELAAEMTLPPLLKDDVTAGRLADKFSPKKTQKTARTFLEAKVAAGELVRVKCVNEYGKAVTVYRKKE